MPGIMSVPSHLVFIFPIFCQDYTGNREGWGEPGCLLQDYDLLPPITIFANS